MKLKLIFLTFLTTIILGSGVFAGSTLPDILKIGLYYQNTSPDSVEIKSEVDNGLDIGISQDGKYLSLIKDNSLNKVIVKKDNYTFDKTDKDPSAFHIQIGDTYKDYNEASAVIKALSDKGFKAYPVYESGLKLWVGVYSSSTAANKDIGSLKNTFSDYQFKIISPSNKRLRIATSSNETKLVVATDLTNRLQISPNPDSSGLNVIDVNNKGYRGAFEFIRQSGSDMTIINSVSLEQYLYSVTSSEMPSSWNIEALKAQAVAARTYALTHVGSCQSLGFDMNPTVEYQAYNGYSSEAASSRRAVDETTGKVAYYNGKPIEAFFFASDGGYTENAENVWSNPVPYLKAVEDKYQPADFNKKNWTSKATPQQVKDYLSSKGVDIGDIIDIKVDSYSKSGNALKMTIVGTKGTKVYTKDNIRVFMKGANPNKTDYEFLFSQTFTVRKEGNAGVIIAAAKGGNVNLSMSGAKALTKNGVTTVSTANPIYILTKDSKKSLIITTIPDSFVFDGHGHGHDIGMSQYGAKGMGDAGFKYDQILKHYYTGIEIK